MDSPIHTQAPEEASPGALYIVGTPIGNLEDMTFRAVRILKEADLIAAEDTRVTRKLLSHFDIHTPLTSYHQHTSEGKSHSLVDKIAEGSQVALVSDAGMPGISDPGEELIRLCIERGLPVIPVPGPTAVATALAASGLSTQRFAFDGFPPRQRKNKRAFFEKLRNETRTVILYEAPHRLKETLRDLAASVGEERQIAVGREITKRHEEWIRGTIGEVEQRFSETPPRGEIVLVIEGGSEEEATAPVTLEEIQPEEGASTRDLTAQLMAKGLSRREAYRLALSAKQESAEEDSTAG